MDPLDFFESEELLWFFHSKKTEMSLMENPRVFLSQLRDHNLILEDSYKKVCRMKSKENVKKAVYNILDQLETKQPQHILVFWKCVFKETIINQYATLRLLRNSLMDGSYRDDIQLPERVEKDEACQKKRKELSEDDEEEEEQEKSAKKKCREQRSRSMSDDVQQPGPSSQLTPDQRTKSKKINFCSPLKKGEKSDIWTWEIFKSQLPVTCGDQEGTLKRDRLAKGEKCILFQAKWYTPSEFERAAGKESSRNWKQSIRCNGTPLGKLLKDGVLKSLSYKGKQKQAKKSLFPSEAITVSVSDEDESEKEEGDLEDEDSSGSSTDGTDEEEESEEQAELQSDHRKTVFNVTCGGEAGTLHKERFASGTCGKSVRTETRWLTPVEFLKKASSQADLSWKKDILCEGEPLSVLIEKSILEHHSVLCTCRHCKPDEEDLRNQENDDECYICKTDGEVELVVCDSCPRSFHQECHLPRIDNDMLGDNTPWMCTFCVFRAYSYRELKMQEALANTISQHILRCQYLILCLRRADDEQTFASDPTNYLRDYTSVIRTPMWLGKVAYKLQAEEYRTVGEFVSDVQLIFTNCATYNRNNAEFLAKGNRLKEFFETEFKNVFNISE